MIRPVSLITVLSFLAKRTTCAAKHKPDTGHSSLQAHRTQVVTARRRVYRYTVDYCRLQYFTLKQKNVQKSPKQTPLSTDTF